MKTLLFVCFLTGCLAALLPAYSASAQEADAPPMNYCQVKRGKWLPIGWVTEDDCKKIIAAINAGSTRRTYYKWEEYTPNGDAQFTSNEQNENNCWYFDTELYNPAKDQMGLWIAVTTFLKDTKDRDGCVNMITKIARILGRPYTFGGWAYDEFRFDDYYHLVSVPRGTAQLGMTYGPN